MEKETLQPESEKEKLNKKYWFDVDDPDETAMLSELLAKDVLFANSHNYSHEVFGKTYTGHSICLFVNCNDVFAWACSDAEDISLKELPELFKWYEKNPVHGSTVWVCLKRKQKPQFPVQKLLKENNLWNDELEALPENAYDEYCRKTYPNYGK